MTKPTNDIYQTKKGQLCFPAAWWPVKTNSREGQAMIDREKRWPLMYMSDGRVLRINRNNLIKLNKKETEK